MIDIGGRLCRCLQHQQTGILTLDPLATLKRGPVGNSPVNDGNLAAASADQIQVRGCACMLMHSVTLCGELTRFDIAARLMASDDQNGHAQFPILPGALTPSCFSSMSNEAGPNEF